ncbi:MAG: hypothetical protein WBM41_17430 [Arenicellales bacterium]
MKLETLTNLSMAGLVVAGLAGSLAGAAENKPSSLAKAAQNPIANMISLPFQNNTNFNFGPQEKTQNI